MKITARTGGHEVEVDTLAEIPAQYLIPPMYKALRLEVETSRGVVFLTECSDGSITVDQRYHNAVKKAEKTVVDPIQTRLLGSAWTTPTELNITDDFEGDEKETEHE
jgi:hypothetical protein